MARFLLVCLGGAAGTGARYLLSLAALRLFGAGFPWGTLTVNVLGSFAMGMLIEVGLSSDALSPTARAALTTGVLGGFTTYSTFNQETLRFLQEGQVGTGVLNLLATVVLALVAAVLGVAAGRWITGG